MKLRSKLLADLAELAIGVGIVVLLLFITSFARIRVDLTSEQRYTLTPATRAMLDSLDDVVYVKIYLTGDLPANLKKLEQAATDLLNEMKAVAPDRFDYTFIDPNAEPEKKARAQVHQTLQDQGLKYTRIPVKVKGVPDELIIFPCAQLTYREKTVPVQLLKSVLFAKDPDQDQEDPAVVNSINNLEYEFASALRQATARQRPRIAFLEGHGELPPIETADITSALREQYEVARVRIDGRIDALSTKNEGMQQRINRFEALIVAAPDSTFTDRDRYILDQFVMNGGKVLWCIDAMDPQLDSLRKNQYSMAVPNELGIEELLFAYGVRLNKDLVIDEMCAPIELLTQPYGDQPRLERFPWYFEPVIIPRSAHPIVANVDVVHTRFIGTLDTISADSVRKTILLTSSKNSFAQRNPVRVSLAIVEKDQGFDRRRTSYMPVAVLLEGRFTSAYRDRLPVAILQDKDVAFRERSPWTQQLVIADGDVIANRVASNGSPYPLGYDRYSNTTLYGNRQLILNAMNYMLGDHQLIRIRSRAITLRLLDNDQVSKHRRSWQVLNLVLPLLITLLAGTAYQFHRRRSNRAPAA